LDAYQKGPDRRIASNILLTIITVLLVGLVLRLARTVIIPLLVAGFLAYLMDPLVSLLRRLRLPVILGVTIAALLYLVAFLVFGWILYHSALDFAEAFPRYQRGLVELIRDLLLRIQNAANTLIGLEPLEELQKLPVRSILLSTLRSLANFLREFLVIFIFTLLYLVGKYGVARKLLRAFPHNRAKKIALVLLHIDVDIRKYIGVKSLASLLVGAGSGACLALFGVDFAVLFGFLTFLLNFIPVIGSVIAVILPLVLSIVQFNSWAKTLWLLAALVVIQNLVAYLFEPKILGIRLKVSVPIVFLSLFFWGWLWGAPGILLALPLTTSLKIVMEDIPGLRPFALLLEKPPRRHAGKRRSV
jgi:predicted PurR-regulated permease PerM